MSQQVIVEKSLNMIKGATEHLYCQNKSGGAVVKGDVAIWDTANSTATNPCFTTTNSQDNKLVMGMVDEPIASNGYGHILREGMTASLKVDGTADISVGSYISTFTTVKIAGLATAGKGGVFAIALEGYSTNDSNGVIDAYIFKAPRMDGTTATLDSAYDGGKTITVDSTAVTLAGSHATNNVLAITNATGSGACLSIAQSGTGADISGTATWSISKAGAAIFGTIAGTTLTLSSDIDLSASGTGTYDLILATNVADALSIKDSAGDLIVFRTTTGSQRITFTPAVTSTTTLTITAGGLTVSAGGVTVTGTSAITGNTTITGDLAVTGSLSFGGNWTVGATLTVDELVLDTDGDITGLSTSAYLIYTAASNAVFINTPTGDTVNISVNATDEYAFGATTVDMNANAIDNCGFIILNAATAPAATEVYLVTDQTGDATLNALSTKVVHLAVAGVDELDVDGAAVTIPTNTVYIGDTANANVTLGLTINHGAADNQILAFKSSDVAHGYTTGAETDTYAAFMKNDATRGGLAIWSFCEDGVDPYSFEVYAYGAQADTTKSTAGTGLVDFYVAEHDGLNALTNITDNGNVFSVRCRRGGVFVAVELLDEDGDLWIGGGLTAATGTCYIGDTSNANATLGLTINQGAADDIILSLKSSDVATVLTTAVTASVETDDYATFSKFAATTGGLMVQALGENAAVTTNLLLESYGGQADTTKTTAGRGLVEIYVSQHDGANALADIASNGNAFVVRGRVGAADVARAIVDAEGDLWLSGGLTLGGGDIVMTTGFNQRIGATTARATTEPTNAINVFNGTAPVGTLANGVTLYSTAGEAFLMDAAGNATQQTQHTKDGDYFINYFRANKNGKEQTTRIHLEKIIKELVKDNPELEKYVEELEGEHLYEHP